MNFKDMLNKISQLSEATKETGKGRIHTAEPGGYGRKDDEDDEGKKVKADAPKRGRGRPKKDADSETGEQKKYDWSAFGGGKQVKLKPWDKEKTRKHSLKEYFDKVDEMMTQQPIPVVGKQGDTQSTGAGFLNIDDSSPAGQAMKDAIGKLAQQKKAQIVMPTGTQASGQKPSATTGGATNQPAMSEEDYSAKKARAGKDIGKPGKQFAKIAKSAGEKYGSAEKGKKVAGAILAKLRSKTNEADIPPQDGLMGAGLGAGRDQGVAEDDAGDIEQRMIAKIEKEKQRLAKLKQTDPEAYKREMAKREAERARMPAVSTFEEQGVAEDDAGDIEQRMIAKIEKEKQRLAKLKQTDPEAYKREMAKREAERARMPAVSTFEEQGVAEGKKPDFLDLDKDGNKKESMKKAATDKKKVKEGMDHRLKAAHHAGKSHALSKQGYNCSYDDMEEARMYHEGFKEGLDECYGQVPIRGSVVADEGAMNTVDDMASFGAHTPAMEDDMMEVGRGQWLKHQAKATPGDTFKAFGQKFNDRDVLETDSVFESWDKQLSSLLEEYKEIQEGISVSVSKGQQGSPDSVSVTAQDGDADKLLQLVKHAGLGLFGGDDHNGYGAPQGEAPQHGGIDVVGDQDGMMALIKKVTGGEAGNGDYADEEGAEDQEEGHDHLEVCEVCGESHCGCDEGEEMVDEVESEDQMTYQVAEDNPPDSGAAEEEEEIQDTAQANKAGAEYDESQEDEEDEEDVTESISESVQLDEWANEVGKKGTDTAFETDIDFMVNVISGGLNKRKVTGQTTIPVVASQLNRQVSHNTTDINESVDPVNEWKKLAGL